MEYVINNSSKTIDAKIFIDRLMIDKGTMGQIRLMVEHPSVDHVRIMPDCHRGNSCCIGFTSKLTDKIVPSFIGVDIGCGISSYKTERKLSDMGLTIEKLEEIIRTSIPMGTLDHCVNKDILVTDDELQQLCNDAQYEAREFASSYGKIYSKEINKSIPEYSIDWLKDKCRSVRIDYDYMLKGLGSL